MSSNLPLGVTENMIPSNRPEDYLYEKLFDRLPKSIQDEINNGTEKGKLLDDEFKRMIGMIFTEGDLLIEMQMIESTLDQNGKFKNL